MGCPAEVEIGDNLVFSVTTQDSSGARTAADAAPTARVYEDEAGTAILGPLTMALLDAANSVSMYSESIACTAANGFEHGKTYTIYVSAAVSGTTGGCSMSFKAVDMAPSPPQRFTIVKDAVSQLIEVLITGPGGQPMTGVVAGDVTWYWLQEGDANETAAVAVNAGTLGTFGGDDGDGAIVEVDATNKPGRYELSIMNNASATGSDLCSHTLVITGAGQLDLTIDLVDSIAVNSSGQFDLGSVYGVALTENIIKSDLTKMLTESHAVQMLKAALDLELDFIVQASPAPTTTSCGTDLDSGSYTLDLTNVIEGRTILFSSGNLVYGATRITGYNGTNGDITFTAIPEAPASTDTGLII